MRACYIANVRYVIELADGRAIVARSFVETLDADDEFENVVVNNAPIDADLKAEFFYISEVVCLRDSASGVAFFDRQQFFSALGEV